MATVLFFQTHKSTTPVSVLYAGSIQKVHEQLVALSRKHGHANLYYKGMLYPYAREVYRQTVPLDPKYYDEMEAILELTADLEYEAAQIEAYIYRCKLWDTPYPRLLGGTLPDEEAEDPNFQLALNRLFLEKLS